VWAADLRSAPTLADRAIAGRAGAGAVFDFLRDDAPGVAIAAAECLAGGAEVVVPAPLRVKLKPGRSLAVWYDLAVYRAGRRHVVVTWTAAGAAAPGPPPPALEAEASARGVLAPFRRAFAGSPDGRTTVRVAPVDPAFPQLVRLHDPRHLRDLLPDPGVPEGADPAIDTVRFRPGQRHVLRVSGGPAGPAWYAKVYRDETGQHAVAVTGWAAKALAAAGLSAVVTGRAAYVAADRVALWPQVAGRPLSALVRDGGPAAVRAVTLAGAALRAMHESASPTDLPPRPDAVAQADRTVRAAQVVDALLPAVGYRVRELACRAVADLAALPQEPATPIHGDYKCDNILVTDTGVHLLDFDRAGRGDPAADLGTFCADLRWWAAGDPGAAGALHAAFLTGYGPRAGARPARARVYDALLQLRHAARRAPLQDVGWEHRVSRAVERAALTLRDGAWP
jgi:aminoglycoside phosphotransferase (APT) family kinase protein